MYCFVWIPFCATFARHLDLIAQAFEISGNGFLRILISEEIFLSNARILRRLGRKLFEERDAPFVIRQSGGIIHIFQVLHLGHRLQAVRSTRMSGDKNQLSIVYSAFGPFQVVIEVHWLVVS